MASSGTYTLSLPNASIITEAFDRIQVPPTAITRHHLMSARTSLNLELIDWENDGFNFWKTISGTVSLVANQAVYTLPANLVILTELWYSVVNGGGAGINQDRIMSPMTREEYAEIPNKLQPGTPTRYWFEMLTPPQITVWSPPAVGAPSYVFNWYGLQQMQDANLPGGETPDAPRRAWNALCARMALRLCEKFGPKNTQERIALMSEKKILADDAYAKFTHRDQEPGNARIMPNLSGYRRMGRR